MEDNQKRQRRPYQPPKVINLSTITAHGGWLANCTPGSSAVGDGGNCQPGSAAGNNCNTGSAPNNNCHTGSAPGHNCVSGSAPG